ncbi:GNAT family N-acetyltransferase [Streptomyces canus]|uniref:GNAT family N-acetyltransferase n=1 Tax=Streptomyces canus TaxID=58343 RepID=UPI00381AEFD6
MTGFRLGREREGTVGFAVEAPAPARNMAAPWRPRDVNEPFVLRTARAEDLDAVNELHSRCSPESLRARYGVSRDRLRANEWRRLSDPAGGRTVIARPADGPDHVIAFASLLRTTRPAVGEASVLVADDWQGMGLGTLLARRLVAISRFREDEGVEASTLRGNVRALKILASLNADIRYPAPGTVWGWLPLNPTHPVPRRTNAVEAAGARKTRTRTKET